MLRSLFLYFSALKFRAPIVRLLVLLPLLFSTAALADVVIVKSSDAGPYKQAEQALRDRLTAPDCNVRSVLVKDLADNGISASISTSDTVVAIGTPAAAWLHNQLPGGVELVYCMVSNPLDAGLLKGPACWGVTTDVSISDQMKLIAEALPHARTVGVLYRSDTPTARQALQLLKDALPSKWNLLAVEVNDHTSVGEAIDTLTHSKADIIWTSADSKLYDGATVRELLLSAVRNGVPVWGFSPAFVRAGALIGGGVDPHTQGEQAADLVNQLKDTKHAPPDKIQFARDYQIAVNLIVADQLGIELPDSLVRRAVYVFRQEK